MTIFDTGIAIQNVVGKITKNKLNGYAGCSMLTGLLAAHVLIKIFFVQHKSSQFV